MIVFVIMLVSVTAVSATDDDLTGISDENLLSIQDDLNILKTNSDDETDDASLELKNKIINAKNGDKIVINPGTYHIHNVTITKNITIHGNGKPSDIIIDGDRKSSIFLINNDSTYVTFKNLTFINGLTHNFGGAISIETGHVYVDYCNFINNTALNNTNAGAISNYGTANQKAYLFVNNSLFINNHADHDGGAVTTCYANSDIYNSVFINNTACRDGGAIRVSIYGYGHVEDCIFMYNHADEWGGAYYSWSGTSHINRCIFMNNTAGTNGGAVMVSGNLNLENSIIVNNSGGETGGSFYIQEPMYKAKTYINVNNNLITNNSAPKGMEVFIKWRHAENLYPNFNNNDWGDENPNDYRVNDPNNVTSRIKVSHTSKSNLLNELNLNLLNRYNDLIKDYFPENYLENIKNNKNQENNENQNPNNNKPVENFDLNNSNSKLDNIKIALPNATSNKIQSDNQIYINSTASAGEDEKAYELNETQSVSKSQSPKLIYVIICLIIIFLALIIGYKKQNSKDK
ncbi:hypothetical protein [Methanobrevibacter sp.]|uniref:hypothetical protein n=1 Tax=Methanobrevibacter sp. TaxID=66852 RepID=UPI0026DFB369|nr:hypothetical protein [Methanobrevibacter sp.]MDO5823066.1 hypothetical protein [Methanobrevibacter sp.]